MIIAEGYPKYSSISPGIVYVCIVVSDDIADTSSFAITKYDRGIAGVYTDIILDQIPASIDSKVNPFVIWARALCIVSVAAANLACANGNQINLARLRAIKFYALKPTAPCLCKFHWKTTSIPRVDCAI